ncbi:MAG TPA: DmsE family decaheme c-type cytochrome [Terriglobia bacterium]|nr:DmsE family decaheme c-type cytochrome [Terriglobia bacterium]
MYSCRCSRPFLVLVTLAVLSSGFWSVLARGQQSQTPAEPKKPASSSEAPSTKAEYATSSACTACHDELSKKFLRNPHQALEVLADSKWKDRACEACHGPGQAHIDAGDGSQIFSFVKEPMNVANDRCRSCHGVHPQLAAMPNSMHGKNQLACIECHSIHEAKHPVHLLSKAPPQLCSRCHSEIFASFGKPFSHHLRENALSCVDCHLPHQGFGIKPKMVSNLQLQPAQGNESACMKCHTNLRGPFVYEHFPIRTDGCMSCHEPHGSTNPKMLTRNQVQFLCLECHSFTSGVTTATQPPSFHNLQSPRYQNCTTCHVKIHGSNVSPTFMR